MSDVLAALKTLSIEEFKQDRSLYQNIFDHVIDRLGKWVGGSPTHMDSIDEIYHFGNTAIVDFSRFRDSALPASVKVILAIHPTTVDPCLVVSATVFLYVDGVRCDFGGKSFIDIQFDIDRDEWVLLGFHQDYFGEYDQYRNFSSC